ncbi:MAG TPA: DEAD/DEAH box helicase [Planctomycetes bacterium]|nr:DEAD/DEAH box helicase [Planctomycetota bacterium]
MNTGKAHREGDPKRGGRRRARSQAASIDALVRELRADPELGPRFTAWHTEPARAGRACALPRGLRPELGELLARRGVESLHEHQARAVEAALAGEDVLIATPTASGKTLAYTLPVLHALLESDGAARSLWMFPTKALSQDQSKSLNGWIRDLERPWHSFTYDGDTPPSVRRTLRDRGHVVLTNPWMLHAGILPNHGKWSELFRDLRTIVIDEVHTLSGVFGSSVANVLRRLVRIARHYGSDPRFLLSSATVRDPAQHGERLIGRPVSVIDEDASPHGKRHFAVFDPPIVNPVAGLRANALEEVRRIAPRLAGPAHQTIFFCNRRIAVEVLTRYLKEAAPSLGLRPEEIRGYRGGYLPLLRREIEDGLKEGKVKVVVTTNALELGIDIGSLDVCVLVGYPGNQASFWQRVGRVGRRGRSSLGVLVARADPVDQYLAHHPEHLFAAPKERIELDPDNLVLLSEQLKCAAFELPFEAVVREEDGRAVERVRGFGDSPHVAGILDYLAEESGLLVRREAPSGMRWFWAADAYPAQDVSLAGNEPDNVLVLDEEGKAIGEMDRESSITSVYEGAIYQVEGEVFQVERFDYENRRAYARRVVNDYFTEAETDTEVRVLRLEEKRARRAAMATASEERPVEHETWAAWRGEVHVTTVATLYKKIRFYTRENVGAEDIHLPPEELDTEAFVLSLSEWWAAELGLTRGNRAAAWGGVGRLLRRVAPLFLRCQSSDLGISTETRSGHFGAPAIYLFDRVPGSVGLGGALFEEHMEVARAALDVLLACACDAGCPACLGPPEEVGALGKETAEAVLRDLVEGARLVPCPPELSPAPELPEGVP